MSRIPHFFIVGAPKCGTTSMSQYLNQHPEIFFSHPKEPNYFNVDFTEQHRRYHSLDSYLDECFPKISEDAIRGEGTVWYLYSQKAVAEILKVNPEAKFIVMLRRPDQLIPSLHNTLLRSFQESEEDLTKAIGLWEERKGGKNIPKTCRDVQLLDYFGIASLGEQVQRLLKATKPESVHFIWHEDLKVNPLQEVQRTLEFIGVNPDFQPELSIHNSRRAHKVKWVSLWVNRLGRIRGAAKLKRMLGLPMGKGPLSAIEKLNTTASETTPISDEVLAQIRGQLKADIDLLSSVTGRDLSAWHQPHH